MIMQHYWGLADGHTYAQVSTTTAQALYPITQSQCQSESELQQGSEAHHQFETGQMTVREEPLENVDEESELGDDNMVFIEDDHDWDSDESDLHDLD